VQEGHLGVLGHERTRLIDAGLPGVLGYPDDGAHQTTCRANHNATVQALDFYEQIGAERKFARLRYLKQRWAERLGKIPGAQVLVGLDPNQSGAFGTIHFETMDPGKLGDALFTKYNILVTPIVAPFLNGIRVSPNVYTSTAEIDRFCDAVEAIVPRA